MMTLYNKHNKPGVFLKLQVLLAAAIACALMLSTTAAALVSIPDQPVPLSQSSVLSPQTGAKTVSGGGATIDTTNANEGYVMVRYSGSAPKVKVQISMGGTNYTYNANTGGTWEVYPMSIGNGTYTINVFTNVSGNQYAMAATASVNVALSNANLPFLYPNQFVNFNANSTSVAKGASLSEGATTKLAVVTNVYNYVIGNIQYDDAKANAVAAGQMTGYVPNVDSVLAAGKGICFDYAALMAAMLRSQGIPTQLQVGYVSGGVYHAWISVYISPETGWINGVIQFDGTNWKLMDPTFAASSGSSTQAMQFIGTGSNYSVMYMY